MNKMTLFNLVIRTILLLVFCGAGLSQAATITVGTNSASPGSLNVIIPVSLAPGVGENVSGLNLDIGYDTSKLTFKEVTTGQASTAAGKTVSSSTPQSGTIRIVVFGLNQTNIAAGVIANISFDIQAAASSGVVALPVSTAIAAAPGATSVSLSGVAGSMTITEAANNPPVLTSIGNKTVVENAVLSFMVSGTDADGDPLTYTTSALPAGAAFNAAARVFSWTPSYAQAGSYSVTFSVSDGKGGIDSETFNINVSNTNRIPVLTAIGNKTVAGNYTLSFVVSGKDEDEDLLTYTTSALPTGATFNAVSRTFSWTPASSQIGSYNVTFTVSDGNGGADTAEITITVGDINQTSVLGTIGNKSVNEGAWLHFEISATDADGDTVTYTIADLPAGASFAGQTFSWSPTHDQAGTYYITFSATDGISGTASETIMVTVIKADETKPTVTGVTFSDPDPVKAQDNFQIKIQYSESMNTGIEPRVTLDTTGSADPVVGTEGSWTSTVYANDTYTTSLIILNSQMEGMITVNISTAEDLAGNEMVQDTSQRFTLDTTLPQGRVQISPSPVIKTKEYLVTLQVTELNGLANMPKLYWQAGGKDKEEIILYVSGNTYQGHLWVESTTPQGEAQFLWAAEDVAGNKNTQLASGGIFTIDTTIFAEQGGISANKDGASVQINPGTLFEDDNIKISPLTMNITTDFILDQTVKPIEGSIRDFILNKQTITLKGEVTISLPYTDSDQDGIVDGTNIAEKDLRMFSFDQKDQRWQLLSQSLAHPEENIVTAQSRQLGRVCIMSYIPPQWGDIKIYPNPCKPGQKVKINNLPLSQNIMIIIYDIAGDKIRELKEGAEIEIGPGSETAIWDTRNEQGEDVASGIYLYLIKSEQSKKSGKIAVVR